ncbi:benzoate 4-monooxygenase cytochrome P450 [Ilyonectria destructans]|nr:benzoate 4-monooxygenase cytochrome P450 [Ilyonectria destructans]
MDVLVSNPDSPLIYTTAFLLGIFLHVGLFRVGEWDLFVPQLLLISTTLYSALIYCYVFYSPLGPDLWVPVVTASKLFSILIAGIYTSIATYRLLFHPLRRFPGPFLAGLTSLYPVWLLVRKLHMYSEVQQLHEKYGDIVRLGPSELSIANVSGLHAIHSAQSPCAKGTWYNIFHPMISVQSARDHKEHAHRRKVWDKGFSAKALRNYEPRVAKYTDLLLSQIQARAEKPIDATLWCNFYGFDVMGDLAFGKSFDMLNDGVAHHYMELMHKATVFGTSFGRFPWAFLLSQHIPIVNIQHNNFLKWLKNQVKKRTEAEPELPDVFSAVLDPYKEKANPSYKDEMHLIGDANLIVVAGSDTTSATMTCALFELVTHPEACKKLQNEVDEFFAQNEGPEHMALSKLKYLQAVVDESMRLHPAVPSGVQRITPPEGMTIDETFIPGNTIVQIPTYTLARDARCFKRPDEFIPERWTTQPELVKDGSAFAPFSMGKYSCVGRQLALMEIRFVLSQIVNRYNISFAPGQTPEAFLDGLVDGFTLMCPKLELVFTPRKA